MPGSPMVRLMLILMCLTGIAHSATMLEFHDTWIPEAPPNAYALAGYGTVLNPGDVDRVITEASSTDFSWIEFHRSVLEEGIAKMIPQESLHVPAKGRFTLEPGGYHMMMMKPARRLSSGDTVEVTLQLGDGTTETIVFEVRERNGGHSHHDHHH